MPVLNMWDGSAWQEVGASGIGTTQLKDYAVSRRTSGHSAVSTNTWSNVDTGLDLVLTAAVGDLIEVGVVGLWNGEAIHGHLDCCSVVSAAPVNYWGTNAAESASSTGVPAWWGPTGAFQGIAGSVQRTLLSGDIDAGTVTLRLRRRNNTVGTKTIYAITDTPLIFWAKNYGATPA